jgi:phospholipid/cholesterol/gamma-HCH transport system permease protein
MKANFKGRVIIFLLKPFLKILEELGGITILAIKSFLWAFRPRFRIKLILRQMEFVGTGSLFIICLTGIFTGMVFALQSINGFRKFNAETMVGGIVALALCRELGPVFSALMVTGRASSAMATEIGTMRITEQIDALTTMAVNPIQYLITPRIIAGLTMVPVLCIVFSVVGLAGAYMVSVYIEGIDPGIFIERVRFHVDAEDITQGIVKAAIFGYIVTLIGSFKGFYASGGAEGVGVATTKAVVMGSVTVLVLDYFLTVIML